MYYAIDASGPFYRVARRRYYRALGVAHLLRVLAFPTLLVLFGVYLIVAAAGWLYYPRRGMALAVLNALLFCWVWAVVRTLSLSRKPRGHVEVFLDPRGLEIRGANAVASVGWQSIVRAVRFSDGILLLQKGLYRWLPDTALQNATPIEVINLLRSSVALEVRDTANSREAHAAPRTRGSG